MIEKTTGKPRGMNGGHKKLNVPDELKKVDKTIRIPRNIIIHFGIRLSSIANEALKTIFEKETNPQN